jgi:transposase
VPGIGEILSLTILYEVHDMTRFDRVQEFVSYARLVKCLKQSGGNTLGTSGAKMGNVHLKWAFSEAAVQFLRHTSEGKRLFAVLQRKHGRGKALSILAHKLGRAVFYSWTRETVFSMEKFLAA